jgi:hypothetical protein
MKIMCRDGAEREINYVDSQLKMACSFEEQGDHRKAAFHFLLADIAEEVFQQQEAE